MVIYSRARERHSVSAGWHLHEELLNDFFKLDNLESQKEWMQLTQEIEDQLEKKYSIQKYQKVEQHWMTIFFVLNYLVDLLPFQFQGELVGSLLTQYSMKQTHWLLTLWISENWVPAVAEPIIKALETTTTFISLIWQGKITAKYLGTDRSILSLDLESATCFHDYTYQLQSSSLDMSVVTWPNTITSWSEFLLLDAGNYFPQLKHSSGNTLVNILPMSAELVNKYLSDVQDQSTSAIDVIADLFCSDAQDAKHVKPVESTTAADSPCHQEINFNVETSVGSSSSQTKITTEIVEVISSDDGDHQNNKPVPAENASTVLIDKSTDQQMNTTNGDPTTGTKMKTLLHQHIRKRTKSLPEQTKIENEKGRLSIKKTAPRGIENIRRKAAIDEMVRTNKCIFPQTKAEQRVSYTKQFRDLCLYYGITNSRGHQACLKDWKYRNLYEKMPVMTADKVLRQCFEVNEAHFKVKVVEPLNQSICDSVMFGVGTALYYTEQLSMWNRLNHDEAFRRIFEILLMKDHKRLALIFMGPSNSGKSYFSNIITGYYLPHRVGQANSPQGNRLTDFWLQEARGCDIKIMEELKLPNEQIAQLFKELFEGNQNLMANRKYRDPLPIQRTPIVVTMNGDRPQELVEWCSKEWDAFANRCHIILFRDSIKNVCGTISAKKVLNQAHDVIGHLAWIYEQRWAEKENSCPELSEQIAKSMVDAYMEK